MINLSNEAGNYIRHAVRAEAFASANAEAAKAAGREAYRRAEMLQDRVRFGRPASAQRAQETLLRLAEEEFSIYCASWRSCQDAEAAEAAYRKAWDEIGKLPALFEGM